MDIEKRLNEFETVSGFQCPAEFWPALEYAGAARYVAIFWEPGGDEACWAEGRDMLVGAGWRAYLALLDANFDWKHRDYEVLGSSDTRATHWLVIDRETERAWMVPADNASQVLHEQWPVYEVAPLPSDSMAEWLAMLQWEAGRVRPVSMVDIEQQMAEGHRRYEALVVALAGRRNNAP